MGAEQHMGALELNHGVSIADVPAIGNVRWRVVWHRSSHHTPHWYGLRACVASLEYAWHCDSSLRHEREYTTKKSRSEHGAYRQSALPSPYTLSIELLSVAKSSRVCDAYAGVSAHSSRNHDERQHNKL